MASTPTVLSFLVIFLTSVHAITYYDVRIPSSRLYSLDTELCCNGTIHQKTNLTNYECCGSKLINTDTEICCYPEVHPRFENIKCCETQPYNTVTHKCVTTFIAMSKRGKTVAENSRIILPIEVKDSCGGEPFNYDEDICCDRTIFAKPDRKQDCCITGGGESYIYNSTTHVCCENEAAVQKINPEDNSCCGTMPYNSDTHDCVNDVLTPKQTGDDGLETESSEIISCSIYNSEKALLKSESNHDDCCGNETYNRDNHVCCSMWFKIGESKHKLYSKADIGHKTCCGTEVMDSQTKTCCFIRRSPYVRATKVVKGANVKCCGLQVMDPEHKECCGIWIIAKPPQGKSGCCVHKVQKY